MERIDGTRHADSLVVILRSCVLLVVQARHIRAELLNPNESLLRRPYR